MLTGNKRSDPVNTGLHLTVTFQPFMFLLARHNRFSKTAVQSSIEILTRLSVGPII